MAETLADTQLGVISEEDSNDVSDPDFVPSKEDDKSSSESETPSPKKSCHAQVDAEDRSTVKTNSKKSSLLHSENSTDARPSLTIKTSSKSLDGKRVWDKKHYCVFCQKPNAKMARHLERMHGNETDVARVLSFTKGSKQRKILLEELRNKGDYRHNINVLEEGRGQVVTWRQPPGKASVEDYLPCQYCLAFFVKSELWKHQMTCKSVKAKEKETRRRVQSQASHLVPVSSSSQGCQNIIHSMQQDTVAFHIRNDKLICKFGDSLYAKRGHEKSQHKYIAQKMRELGRLMVEIKKMDKTVQCLKDVCKPCKFELAIKGAKAATGFCPIQNEFEKPSTAVKMGYSLKRAAEVLVGQSLMNGDEVAEKEAKNFLRLMDSSWSTYVSCNALKTIEQNKWNKEDAIPLTEDIIILKEHLQKIEEEAKKELKANACPAAYRKLNESLLAQVIIFNRRREGEASQLLLQTYLNRNRTSLNKDVYDTLSPLEKQLSKKLTRIEIRGKRGRKVPILLTENMKSSLDILIKCRDDVGVPAENPYVFARQEAYSYIRGSDCLRKYAFECKAKNPERLTSTKLRKHVATLCQLLNLEQHELEQVAKFMGHDIRVHCDYYRLSENTIQLTKMSKLLFAMERGVGAFKGKNLDSLHLSIDSEDHDPASPPVPIGSHDHSAVSSPVRKRSKTAALSASHDTVSQRDTDQSDHSAVSSPVRKRSKTAALSASHDTVSQRDTDQSDHSAVSSPVRKRSKTAALSASHDTVSQRDTDQSDHSAVSSPVRKRSKTAALSASHDTVSQRDTDQSDHSAVSSPVRKRSKTAALSASHDTVSQRDTDQSDHSAVSSPVRKRSRALMCRTAVSSTSHDAVSQRKDDEHVPKLKRPWSEEEKAAVTKHLAKFMALRRVPGKKDCASCLNAEPILQSRTWKDIKNCVYNTIVSLKRKQV